MKNTITTFLVLISIYCSAQFTRIPNQRYNMANLSDLAGDTFNVYTVSDTGSLRPLNGTEIFEIHKFYVNSNNQVGFSNSIFLKDSFPTNTISSIKSLNYNLKIGNLLNYKTNQKSTIWIKQNNSLNFDSINILPILDSNYVNTLIYESKIIDNHLYLFGGIKKNTFPYNKSMVLKYNLITRHFQLKTYDCYATFCLFYDALYDSINGNFIVISPKKLSDTLDPYSTGAGIAKIDTNLNLIPNTVQTLNTNLILPLLQTPPFQYNYNAAIEPINDSSFIIAGSVNNPQNLNSILNLSPHEWQDLGVGVRSINSLLEIRQPLVYGKADTSDIQPPMTTVFKKMDQDFYISANSSKFNNITPESWNTSLALHALNDNGELHWEYYMSFGDYCWAQDIVPDEKGGLWVTAQCTESANNPFVPFGFFTKVAYIDSVAFWPRIGGLVDLKEWHKNVDELSVYPNPSSDILIIKQNGLIQPLQFRLMDLNGRVVLEKRNKAHANQLNIQSLPNGVYFLTILNENGSFIKSEKIIKQ